MRKNNQTITVIDGNICAGKSYRCNKLKDDNTIIIKEVHINNPYLSRFYGDPNKWAFVMQMFMLEKRKENYGIGIKQMLETGKNLIFDRSIWSDEIFFYPNAKYMTINQRGKYLNKRNKTFQEYSEFKPDVVEYLDVSPMVCKERIPVRVQNNPNLKCELNIPLEYLIEIDRQYKPRWIKSMRNRGCFVDVKDWSNFGLVDQSTNVSFLDNLEINTNIVVSV